MIGELVRGDSVAGVDGQGIQDVLPAVDPPRRVLPVRSTLEETNQYSEALRDLGGHLVPHGHLLWIMRIALIGAFAVQLHAAFSVDRRNRQAIGKSKYEAQNFSAANYASRTMLWSGIIVGLFIIFHVADLTWGATNDDFVGGDAYNNQIASFSNPAIVDSPQPTPSTRR